MSTHGISEQSPNWDSRLHTFPVKRNRIALIGTTSKQGKRHQIIANLYIRLTFFTSTTLDEAAGKKTSKEHLKLALELNYYIILNKL